jgi:hypothetical protein
MTPLAQVLWVAAASVINDSVERDNDMRHKLPVSPALWIVAAAAFVPLCAIPDTSADNQPNNFPTLARVEYVLRCMDYHGGQIYENMYACVCSIDRIATEFSYDEFVKAEVLAQLRTTPGERGGLFREGGKEQVTRYVEVTEAAEESCFGSHGPA